MRVFRNREEAEKAGFQPRGGHDPIWFRREGPERPGPNEHSSIERAIVRTPLEAMLAAALEAVEWNIYSTCPACDGVNPAVREEDDPRASGHEPDCKLSAALRAFRGEAS